jgi:hypothetical protein
MTPGGTLKTESWNISCTRHRRIFRTAADDFEIADEPEERWESRSAYDAFEPKISHRMCLRQIAHQPSIRARTV